MKIVYNIIAFLLLCCFVFNSFAQISDEWIIAIENGQLETDNPAKGNIEFEAKTIKGIVKAERRVSLSGGSESIPQAFGQGLLNNQTSFHLYFNTANKWKNHPQTAPIYKRKIIQQTDPKYLIKLLNK